MMEFVKEHLGFVLTIIITYVLGISLINVQYMALSEDSNFMKVLLDSLIPTTITYVLGCVLVNISELLLTAALLWLNLMCYKEKYQYRSHSLT